MWYATNKIFTLKDGICDYVENNNSIRHVKPTKYINTYLYKRNHDNHIVKFIHKWFGALGFTHVAVKYM